MCYRPNDQNGIIRSRSHYNNEIEFIRLLEQLVCYTKGKKVQAQLNKNSSPKIEKYVSTSFTFT